MSITYFPNKKTSWYVCYERHHSRFRKHFKTKVQAILAHRKAEADFNALYGPPRHTGRPRKSIDIRVDHSLPTDIRPGKTSNQTAPAPCGTKIRESYKPERCRKSWECPEEKYLVCLDKAANSGWRGWVAL